MFHGVPGDLNPRDVRYDPADAAHLSIESDGRVRFRIVTEPSFSSAAVVTDDGVGHGMALLFDERTIQVWETTLDIADGVHYTFALRTHGGRPVYRVPAGISNAVERLDRWTVDRSSMRTVTVPGWSRGMTIYQIFPERFENGDPSIDPHGVNPWGSEPGWLDFQGGDLAGIAARVDHLETLGVDCVYLNPVFESPSTHRYDAIDYYSVDAALGGNDAMRSLIDTLHARGIRVIVDASFNHCHPRFFAFADLVEKGPASEYVDWFNVTAWPPSVVVRPGRFAAEAYRSPDEYLAYVECFARESGISVRTAADDGPAVDVTYDAWHGVPSLPRINLANPGARTYFLEVARHWVREYGIDGWRMDVARYVDFDFWPEFRSAVKAENPDAYLIAEIMGDASDWLQGDTFDATMNYTFRQLALDFFATQTSDGFDLADGLARMFAAYAPEAIDASQNLLGSHDTARFLHEAGDRPERLHLATVMQLTLPGSPGLYYGDEVGMTGGEEPASRGAFPWHDPDRWDDVQLDLVRTLAALRATYPVLRSGALEIVARADDAIAYTRADEAERLLVAISRDEAHVEIDLPVRSESPEVLWGDAQAAAYEGGIAITGLRGTVIVRL
jgi:cyclomaltodextrinase